jgi:opacity protein-like surface antigen
MKYQILSGALFAALLAGGHANAQQATDPGFYSQFNVGSGIAGSSKISANISGVGSGSGSEDLKPGVFVSGAIGKSLPNGFAIEGELLYLDNNIKTDDLDSAVGTALKASMKTVGLMANLHYAVAPVGPTTFYVGAGVGVGQAKYELLGSSDDKTGAMWQLMAGFSYPMSSTMSWDLGYRYVGVPDYEASATSGSTTAGIKVESRVHVLSIGLRSKF